MSGQTDLYPQSVLGEDAPLWFAWGLALLGVLGAVAAALLAIQSLPNAPPDYSVGSRGPGQVSRSMPPADVGGRSDFERVPSVPETPRVTMTDGSEAKVVGEPVGSAERGAPKAGQPAQQTADSVLEEPAQPLPDEEDAAGPQVAADEAAPSESLPARSSAGGAPASQALLDAEGQPEEGQAEADPAAVGPITGTAASLEPAPDMGTTAIAEADTGSLPAPPQEVPPVEAVPEAEPRVEQVAVPDLAEAQSEERVASGEAESALLSQQSTESGTGGAQDTMQAPTASDGSKPASVQIADCPPLFVAYFDRDRERPTMADPSAEIAALASWLMASPRERITVEGHTDTVGASEYNLYLSRRRAQVVADMLVDAGVSADQLVVRGYGESVPVNQSVDPRLNRRVSFSLVGREGCPSGRSD